MRRKQILSATIIGLLILSTFAIILPQACAGPTPEINVTTTTDKTSAKPGDVVTYTFEVTNVGKVTLFNVQVSNNLIEPAIKQTESGRTANDKLEPGETWTFTATYTVTANTPDPFQNTATATAYTRKGIAYTATDIHSTYIYGKAGDVLPDVLTSPNQEPNGGWYGCSVAVGEGLIVVGAAYESIPNPLYDPTLRRQTEPSQIYGAGRVYIYSATNGALLKTLGSPNPTAPGWFGYSVAIGEGVIVIGAPKETSGSVTLAGNAYVYNAETYAYIATLTSTYPVSNGDGQGYGISVAVGGGIIAVGSSWETVSSASGAGRVYLYNAATRLSLGSPLSSPNPQYPGRFGWSVAVNTEILVVGAAYEDAGAIDGAGKVYIYNAADRTLTDTVVSPNAEYAGHFGFSVDVGSGIVSVGAFDETVAGKEDAGRVYIYSPNSKTIDHTLVSQTPEYRGFFSSSVAIDDGAIVVGAELESSGSYADAGKAYVFSAATGDYSSTLNNLNPAVWDTFGWSVAASSGIIAVGAYDAVFIFE